MILSYSVLLLTMPVFLLSMFALIMQERAGKKAVDMLASEKFRAQLFIGFSRLRRLVALGATLLGLAALWIALARPQAPLPDVDDQAMKARGRDVMIAVDVSRSMLAADCPPSRLETVKKALRELIQKFPADRFGLMVFAGSAYVQCPLTPDHATLLLFLDALDATTVSGGSTNLSAALTTAVELFQRDMATRSKVLMVYTDGEDFSTDLTAITQQAQKIGINICVVGVGTPEGAPIPLYTPQGLVDGHMHDAAGKVVISRLNEPLLQQVAQSLQGSYIRLNGASAEVQQSAWLEQQSLQEYAVTTRPHAELQSWWTAGGFCLLLLGWLL